jgi:hypothetical protein
LNYPNFTPAERHVISSVLQPRFGFADRMMFECAYMLPVLLCLVWGFFDPQPVLSLIALLILGYFRFIDVSNSRQSDPVLSSVIRKYEAAFANPAGASESSELPKG